MLASELNWNISSSYTQKRLTRRLKKGRYEGVCPNGQRVRIDAVDGGWELYMGTKFMGKYPLKRTALNKANALLTSDKCDEHKINK